MAEYRTTAVLPVSSWSIRLTLLLSVLLTVGEAHADKNDRASKVALFSQPFCPGCEAAKQYLGDTDVDFVEFDISSSPEARDAFERLGGRGTPLLLIDGKRLHGFWVPVIEQRLRASGLLEERQ